MKKIIVMTVVLLLSVSSVFAAELASNTPTSAGVAIYGGDSAANALAAVNPLVRLSTGVSAISVYDANGGAYALGTKHLKGSKIFATANDSTKLYWKTGTANQILAAGDIGTTSSDSGVSGVSGMTPY